MARVSVGLRSRRSPPPIWQHHDSATGRPLTPKDASDATDENQDTRIGGHPAEHATGVYSCDGEDCVLAMRRSSVRVRSLALESTPVPSACRNQRKRTETTVTECKLAERHRRRQNAGGMRSCASCLRFVICRESALILICTQGVRGSNPLVSTRYPLRQMQVFSP